jgi:PA14 domain
MKRWSYPFIFFTLLALAACFQAPQPTEPENPDDLSATAFGGTGLTGVYFDNMDFTGTQKTEVNTYFNKAWPDSPTPGIASTTYSIRWTGQIVPAYTEEYTFYYIHTDGGRLMINGQVIINNWKDQARLADSGKIILKAGVKYDIRLEYYRNATNPAVMRLDWQSARQARQIVPMDSLFPTGSNLQTAINTIQANPKFQALGVTLNPLNALASIDSGTIAVHAREGTSQNFFIAIVKNNSLGLLLRIKYQNNRLIGTNVLTGKEVDLGLAGDYIDTSGNTPQAKFDALKVSLKPLIVDARLLSKSQASIQSNSTQQMSPQAVITGACPDGDCQQRWTDYQRAEDILRGTIAGAVLTGALGGCADGARSAGVYGCVASGAIWAGAGFAGSLVVTPANYGAFKDREKDIFDCIDGNDSVKGTNGDGCPAKLTVEPPQIQGVAKVGQSYPQKLVLRNVSSAGIPLSVFNFQSKVTSASGSFTFSPNFIAFIDPGGSYTIDTTTFCPSTPTTVTAQLSFDTYETSTPRTVTVDVKLECRNPNSPRMTDPRPNPLVLIANPGQTVSATTVFGNIGDAPLTHSSQMASSLARITAISGPVQPNALGQITVTATCPSQPTTENSTLSITHNDPLRASPTPVTVKVICMGGNFYSEVKVIGNGTYCINDCGTISGGGVGGLINGVIVFYTPGVKSVLGNQIYVGEVRQSPVFTTYAAAHASEDADKERTMPGLLDKALNDYIANVLQPNQCLANPRFDAIDNIQYLATVFTFTGTTPPSRPYCSQ